MISVTDKVFLGLVRNRSSGDLKSGVSGLGSRGASMDTLRSLSLRLVALSTTRLDVSQQGYQKQRMAYRS